MADLNVWSGTGRLTRDPELRSTSGGTSVCNFRIATNGFKDDDTSFRDVVVWGKNAENCARYLSKGDRVAIAGSEAIREYPRRDGGVGTSVEVTANTVTFLNTKGDRDGGSGLTGQRSEPAATPTDDDIPF